jgi:class 3 adenylate cyclase/predicted ATPase
LPPKREAPEAERRHLTLMFCDLAGSTALSVKLDPEDLRDVVRQYQATCAKVIARFDGHIAQYLGDGILVYFGYPTAHENDAQRAVRTGLGIVEAMDALNRDLQPGMGVKLEVRVGIHTGLVVVGEMGGGDRHEQLALGKTPNIAARLESLASSNSIIISAATHRLVAGFFECDDLGTHSLKGVAEPMQIYRVLHESTARSRLEVAALSGLTPLVGREQEASLLLTQWHQMKEGAGRVILLSGEAGIGKSRMVQVLKERAAEEPDAWLTEIRCSSDHQNAAFHPIIDLLERVVLAFEPDDTPRERLKKIEGFLVQYGLPLQENAPLLAALLSVSLGNSYLPANIPPERQKHHTIAALVSVLLQRASHQPVLLVIEDLQWADPLTLEMIKLIIDKVSGTRVLALLTFRPDFPVPWQNLPHVLTITLEHLRQQQTRDFVHRLAHGKTLPNEVLEQIVARTDGVPLFVEELTKMVLESGMLIEHQNHFELAAPLPPLAIPATLHDSLMARLDRMATVKEVAQLGATIGREFSYELLHLVSQLDHDRLQNELERLVAAGLLYETDTPPRTKYVFKHALIREAAYEALLKSTRQLYHARIGQVLAERFPHLAESRPELIAYHYTEARLFEIAVPFWYRAAQRASRRSLPDEAIVYLNKGLALIRAMPESPDKTQQELEFLISLGSALVVTKGHAASEVERTYACARERAMQLGEHPHLYSAVQGLSTYYLIRGEFQSAQALAEQALRLAARVQDPALLVESHHVLGTALFHLGYLKAARSNLEEGIALYEVQQHRAMVSRFGHDSGILCLCYLARILWFQGYPAQAQRRSAEAMVLARELEHPFSLALALTFAALVSQVRMEIHVTRELAEEAIALCTAHGFTFCLAMAAVLHGWALTELDQQQAGIAQIEEGIKAWQATGAELFRPHLLALLAESYGKAGRLEEGLQALAEAMTAAQKSGKRFYAAELNRLKGMLFMKTGRPKQEVEQCFYQALEIARNQQAKSLELRAAVGLLSYQENNENAQQILQEAYDWFKEGFDTLDLQLAGTLLARKDYGPKSQYCSN